MKKILALSNNQKASYLPLTLSLMENLTKSYESEQI